MKINKLKNISSLNKDITSAFDKIETGYQEKDKKKIEKGQQNYRLYKQMQIRIR